MKMLCMLALVALVAGQGKPICFPPEHHMYVHHISTGRAEADVRHEYNSFTQNMFAFRQLEWRDHAPDEEHDYHHVWIYPSNGTAYVYTHQTTPGHNTTSCDIFSIPSETVRDPCFTQNGTHQRTYTVGGVLTVDVFYGEEHTHRGDYHGIMGVTPGFPRGIPVEHTSWVTQPGQGSRHAFETFHDVNITLPDGVFFLNSVCARYATPNSGSMPIVMQRFFETRLR
eukprot:NODE_624_length_775_cov_129.747934_g559_i0.p1 GENE.NODE_624_length_775_cov_129.747934_g559_i0~~NODE_624_length_775_cov_129.747934_g559_i0.p1  ORF type:complete len:226 (+),score=40.49 NODE_624_length_775_cov_129.747934_g559_i0:2-679(+)